jgi:hypothetical protein
VVVLRGEQHVSVGPIDDLPEAADHVVDVVAACPGRRFAVEEGAMVPAGIDGSRTLPVVNLTAN